MSSRHRIAECIHCHETRRHKGRGLCDNCYFWHHRRGILDRFERINYAREELLEEWNLLRLEGYTRAQAAERLGITKARLEKAIERASRERVAA